jgi:hypothetical protein
VINGMKAGGLSEIGIDKGGWEEDRELKNDDNDEK